jgi:hypothetical protein
MLTRRKSRFPLAVRLLLTALSVAFAFTFASAFSFGSAAPLADAAGIHQTAPAHHAAYAFKQNPFTAAASLLHRKHLAHLAWLAKQKAEALEKAKEAAAAAYARAHPPKVQAPPATHAPAVQGYTTYSGALSSAQVGQLWLEAGGPAWAEPKAVEIAYCESGFNPRAYNPSGASGIWQILGQVVGGNVFDPLVNAENAVAKFKGAGNSFAPWVCQ